MIRATQAGIEVSGSATISDASALLAQGVAALNANNQPITVFDLAGVTTVDSSLLAVVFGWMRAAKACNQSIRLLNLPENFVSLAAVYDVADLLPQY